jgi:hypothetical protein
VTGTIVKSQCTAIILNSGWTRLRITEFVEKITEPRDVMYGRDSKRAAEVASQRWRQSSVWWIDEKQEHHESRVPH